MQRDSDATATGTRQSPGFDSFDFQKAESFLLHLTSNLNSAGSEPELLKRAEQSIRQFFNPISVFLAFPDARLSSRYQIHWTSTLQDPDQTAFHDFLQNLLVSGLDSVSIELLESLPLLEGISKVLVKSPAVFAMRILVLILGSKEFKREVATHLAGATEQLLRSRLEAIRLGNFVKDVDESLESLHTSAEVISREIFWATKELLPTIAAEASRVLHTDGAAILIPKDETKTEFCVSVQCGFTGDQPLSSALFSKAFEDFQTSGNRAIVYHLGQNETHVLVPLIQRGEATSILSFFSQAPDFELGNIQRTMVEIYAYWISIAIENGSMFERLSNSQAEWENTFDSIADPIYIIDNEYRLKKMNKSLASTIGKSVKLPLNRNCYRYLFQQDAVCPWCPVPESKKNGQPVSVEAGLFSGGPWRMQSFPYTEKSGARIGSINVLNDLTLIKKMQEQLIESEKLASIGKLISGVAHEVRNPLFGISATVRALANELGNKEELAPFLEVITSETSRLNRLMEDLLSYSRPARIDKNPSDLAEIVQEVIEHFRLVPYAQNVTICLLDSERVPPINVDRNGIKQVLLNLFENGIQHAGDHPEITVLLQYISLSIPPEIHLIVKDNGTGIDSDRLARVFDPFFTTRSKGTGLGLSIVRKVIHDHRGRISVESHPGVGTTFRISLPVSTSEP